MKKTLFLLIMILFTIPTYTQCLSGDCNNGYGEKSYNGHIYKGNFLNGKRDGYGEYFWEFGDVYKGYWKNDDWDGYGERTYAAGRGIMSGVIEKGRWENGILVDPNAKPKINKPLVNKNNSNSQNKSVASNQKKSKTPIDKKSGLPVGWEKMSVKELSEWMDNTEEGRKLASNMMSGVVNEMVNQSLSSNSNTTSGNQNISGKKCSKCNVKFKFKIWKGGQNSSGNYYGGWATEEVSRPGFIKCSCCNGYGVNWDFDNNENRPRSKECYCNTCDGGWVKCNH